MQRSGVRRATAKVAEGHTHAAFDQLRRGLLWQRLNCRPGMLGESWRAWEKEQSFVFHVQAWLANDTSSM